MSVLVPSNELLRNRASWCRLLLMGCQVRLFRQPASIDPATLVASFVECNFPGYAPIEIVNATLNGVNKVLDGQYEFSSIPLIWTPTANDDQLAYGLFISRGGDDLVLRDQLRERPGRAERCRYSLHAAVRQLDDRRPVDRQL